jgi:hypothetical protein
MGLIWLLAATLAVATPSPPAIPQSTQGPVGQAPAGPAPPRAAPGPVAAPLLRVFLDCNECDTTYVRQNIEFVDYVRDRAVADVHVLVTTRSTGSGGLEWTMRTIGLGRYLNIDRTVTFSTTQSATSDDRRREFARVFKLGMVGYAADTSVGKDLDITWTPPATSSVVARKDPWNFWVFRTDVNGNVNGEKSASSRTFRGSLRANRVTDRWKIDLSANGSVSENRFELSDNTTVRSTSDSWSADALVVKSVGPRWSVGGRASANHSSFSNTELSVGGSPGIEYNFFPYAESNRRSLTVRYSAGASTRRYRRITLFDRMKETVPTHALDVGLGLRQPWGSLGAYSSLSQHLGHRDRYRIVTYGSTDVRLFKGFSFNIFAEYDKINDQIGLPRSGASSQEILLRLQQLSTNYSYFFSMGFSYSFGSIFNSVVNPRFNGLGSF